MTTQSVPLSTEVAKRPALRLNSYTVYLLLMAYLVAIKLVVTFLPVAFRSVSQAAVFDWPFLAFWTAAGLAGIFLSLRTGFPDAWDEKISHWRRFGVPVALGLFYGAAFFLVDKLTGYSVWSEAFTGGPMNIAFPASALIYPGGAVVVEVFYRLLFVPLFLWLISNVLLRGRGQNQVFWVLAALTSLIEPGTQDLMLLPISVGLFVPVFVLDYVINLSQATLFRKYGFLAAIVMRVAFYAIWHIAYVH